MSHTAPRITFIHSFPSLPAGTSLVQVLIQLGPDLTSDPEVVRALLMRFGISDASPPRDAQVIEIVSTLGRLAAEGTTMCDVAALVRALSSFVSTLPPQTSYSLIQDYAARPHQLGKRNQVL